MQRCRKAALVGIRLTAGMYAMAVAYHCSIAAQLRAWSRRRAIPVTLR